jgi:hypothetical protein
MYRPSQDIRCTQIRQVIPSVSGGDIPTTKMFEKQFCKIAIDLPDIQLHDYRNHEGFHGVKPRRGVPSFGFKRRLRIFMDPDLLQYDEVWAAAGTWNDVFPFAPNDLVRASGAVVTDLKR